MEITDSINPTECSVLSLLVQGKRPKQIEEILMIGRGSAQGTIDRLRLKFGVKTNVQLISIAYQQGWITNPYQEQQA